MKKFWILLIGFFILILLILRGIPFLINQYLNANADRIVTNLITRTSFFGGHEISFGNIRLDYNYFGTYLKIENIRVFPSKELAEDDIKVDLTIDNLNVTGFQWSDFFMRNSISVDSALINNIRVVSSGPPIDSLDLKPKKKPKKEKSKDYDLIEVKHFDLNKLNIEVVNNLYDSVRISLKDMDLHANNFQLTKEDIEDPKSLFHVDWVKGSIQGAEFHFDKFRQYAKVEGITLDTKANTMSIGYLGLLNKLGRYEYTSQFADRQSWTQITEAQMDMKGVHFSSFFRKGIVEIDTVYANNMHVEIFVDKRKPEDLEKRPQMVHQIFGNLRQIIHIDHTFIKNGYLKIEERPDNKSPRSGYLYFSDMNAHAINVSNYIEKRGENKLLRLEASGKLMGLGLLNAVVQYDLENVKGNFSLKGSLGKMDLTSLRTMIEPQAKASIKSGQLNNLSFDIQGNDYDGTGKLTFLYENLEVELLNQDFERDRNVFRQIGAFIANNVVIKSNNPKKNGETMSGTVYYIRDTHKSMFSYWWKLIFSGLKSTLTGDDLEKLKKKELERVSGDNGPKNTEKESNAQNKSRPQEEKLSRKEKREARKESKKSD
ncbi:hypothetical protein [Shivajiella indica]|uniref:DUF748 domain-containing protein n=1 Tax=Shivajiella indica TaxID=872115 RepID=A0ABW5B1J9_9BACT